MATKTGKKRKAVRRWYGRKVNLNRAMLKPRDLENLRIRISMMNDQNNRAEKEQLRALVIAESCEDYKTRLLKDYGLRPGKKYNFDLRTGEITNVKSPPKKPTAEPQEPTPSPEPAATEDALAAEDTPTEPAPSGDPEHEPLEPAPSTNGSPDESDAA